jgi:predicted dehydrogenase
MLRMAVIGAGWAGNRHLEAVRELGRKVEVVCLVDSDAAHLAAVAQSSGVGRTTVDYAEALADADIDAVSLCTPHALHAPMAVAAAEAGKHILCEKPMAMTVEQATRMVAAAQMNSVTLYVAENASYSPRAHFLRRVLAGDERDAVIGEPTSVSVVTGFAAQNFGYAGRRAWLAEPEQGGSGAWLLQGIHTVAEMRSILVPTCGEVETVYAREHKARSFVRRDLEGTVSTLITFATGLNVSLLQTAESRLPGNLKAITLRGDEGSVRATAHAYEYVSAEMDDVAAPQRYAAASLSPYAQEMEAFADAVAGDGTGLTDGRSERLSLAVVQAGYESMQSGRPVHISARFGDLDSA